jgi:SAM-dependent methyltransferase
LPLEVEFWSEFLRTQGGDYPADYRRRLDPIGQLTEPLILEAIDRTDADPIRILDVGAGPITVVGQRDPRDPARKLEVVAVDPLAGEYARLMQRFRLNPPVRTQQLRGEDIADVFGSGAFDIVYARNALDHSVDPMAIIENMVRVVKPGGTIALRHYRREGEQERYEQLHQWNFDVQDGNLWLWSRRRRHNVTERLNGRASVRARLKPTSHHADWVEVSITRSATAG